MWRWECWRCLQVKNKHKNCWCFKKFQYKRRMNWSFSIILFSQNIDEYWKNCWKVLNDGKNAYLESRSNMMKKNWDEKLFVSRFTITIWWNHTLLKYFSEMYRKLPHTQNIYNLLYNEKQMDFVGKFRRLCVKKLLNQNLNEKKYCTNISKKKIMFRIFSNSVRRLKKKSNKKMTSKNM